MEINQYIDHTLLKADATEADIRKLCDEAIKHKFFSVCVNSSHVKLAKDHLFPNTKVKVCSVIGFPLGAANTVSKVAELEQAKLDGADEFDMVINIGMLRSQQFDTILDEIKKLKVTAGAAILKVIIETCYLTKEEITKACELAVEAKADFVKTSTGFGSGGATLENIQIMKKAVNGNVQLKASGGIRDYTTAKKYIDSGVTRIGTSNGIAIVPQTKSTDNY